MHTLMRFHSTQRLANQSNDFFLGTPSVVVELDDVAISNETTLAYLFFVCRTKPRLRLTHMIGDAHLYACIVATDRAKDAEAHDVFIGIPYHPTEMALYPSLHQALMGTTE